MSTSDTLHANIVIENRKNSHFEIINDQLLRLHEYTCKKLHEEYHPI